MNRLAKANYNEREESFTYDLAGNRLSQTINGESSTFIYNTKNQLTEIHKDLGITSFTYDTQGNILKESNPKGITSFEYNALNQQTKVTTYQGNTLINRYDAEGVRAEIEENQKLTRFIFHRDEILVEANENDTPISRFARGYNVVAADISGNEQQGIKRYYYQLDEQFSTSFITNSAGKVENRYTYDAFGNTLENQENVHNRIKYTGQQYDPVTEQYYLRARFYNPILGRFMQEDVYRGDGLNLYAYCRNNPVMYYDPSGYATQGELANTLSTMSYDEKKTTLYSQYEQFIQKKVNNGKVRVSQDDLIKNELITASYDNMPQNLGDKLTPHHMPVAKSLENCKDNIDYGMGTSLNVREDTHSLTFTYGMSEKNRPYDTALYNSLSYEDRLKFDHQNIKQAYELQRPNVSQESIDSALKTNYNEAMENHRNNNSESQIENGKCKK